MIKKFTKLISGRSKKKTPHEILDELLSSEEAMKPIHPSSSITLNMSSNSNLSPSNSVKKRSPK